MATIIPSANDLTTPNVTDIKEPAAVKVAEVQDVDEMQTSAEEDQELDLKLSARDILNLWDGITHCAEPPNCQNITEMLKACVKDEENLGEDEVLISGHGKTTRTIARRYTGDDDFNREFSDGRCQVSWSKDGTPRRHKSWPADFVLVVNEENEKEPYFQVFESKIESIIVDTTDKKRVEFDFPEVKHDPDHLVYRFNRKYLFGPGLIDEDGNPKIGMPSPDTYFFNYAEHAILGNRVLLKFPGQGNPVRAGDRPLKLENGVSVTYGQINGLGGDFFATTNPICTGSSFDQQRKYFEDAYALLGKAATGLQEVKLITQINDRELQAVQHAVDTGSQTGPVYKDLANNDPASSSLLPMTGTDEQLTMATMKRDGPNYLHMALLNLDHFGNDARTAYNAGHTCALRAAADGNLELGYAMNAFADHYLGDCFASGHIRTPRSKLHAEPAAIEKVCKSLNDVYEEVLKATGADGQSPGAFKKALSGAASVGLAAKMFLRLGNIKDMAADMCSKFMHDEDNLRGLVVSNPRGDRWVAFGDTKLFDAENKRNMDFMKQALQVSADEIYQAYESHNVPGPNNFGAWRIAPDRVIEQECHRPLFNAEGWYRKNYDDPYCNEYMNPKSGWTDGLQWKVWKSTIALGYSGLLGGLKSSNYFKNL